MNTDEIKGATKEVGGAVRKNVGKLTGDKEGETRGAVDEAAGNIQKNYGKIKDAVNN